MLRQKRQTRKRVWARALVPKEATYQSGLSQSEKMIAQLSYVILNLSVVSTIYYYPAQKSKKIMRIWTVQNRVKMIRKLMYGDNDNDNI